GGSMGERWRRTWTAVTVIVWCGLTFGFAAYAWFFPSSHTVYDVYAPAARKWWGGEDIYTLTRDYYRYSPLFAVACSPFALLPDPLGGALWKTWNCFFYAFSLWVAARRLLRLDSTRTGGLFLLVLPLSLHSMYIGQANLLMLGAILLGLSAA